MTPTHVRMMAAYGAWMNGRMLDLCGTLTDAERKRDLGAFFKSVHGTFDHLIYGDVAWMGRFTGSPMPSQRIGVCVHDSLDGLTAARRVLVTHLLTHATHHRGQLTTLMKQLGIEPGVTDLPWLPALYDGRVLSATEK